MAPDPTDGAAAVDAYLAAVPSGFREALQRLRSTIRAAAPGAVEVISYRMPAFRQDGILVYYAAFRDHLSFFPGSVTARSRFARELRPFESGRGTYRFTPDHPIPARLVRAIVKVRLAENAANAPARRPRPRARR